MRHMSLYGRNEHRDVLLLVLDCVRGRELLEGSPTADRMLNLRSIQREGVAFDRAVSPAPWTVPAHASLLTGLYPWEHGLHAHGRPLEPDRNQTVIAQLRRAGYQTLCLSANPQLNDRNGLTLDFESAVWGAPWEQYLRHLTQRRLHGRGRRAPRASPGSRLFGRIKSTPVLRRASQWPLRHSAALDMANRFLYGLRRSDTACEWCVAEWVEPTLRTWLESIDPHVPAFMMVNLMDAHEPYLWTASMRRSMISDRTLRVRQDQANWVLGEWTPEPEELRRLEALYRAAVTSLDHRIGAVIQTLQRANRWADCGVILTGDHGQAFGSGGLLMHGLGLEEDLLRVPLIVRAPGLLSGGAHCGTWTSLIDVAPTLLQLALGPAPNITSSATSLLRLAQEPRREAVWSVSDGLFGSWDGSRIDPGRRARLDRIQVAAYQGRRKSIYDAMTQTAQPNAPVELLNAAEGEETPAAMGSSESADFLNSARQIAAALSTTRSDAFNL